MRWSKGAVAAGTLALSSACSAVVFDGMVNGDRVRLEESDWIIRKYDLTVMKGGYTYHIRDWGANGSADSMAVDCPGRSVHCSIGHHGGKQELYDYYTGKLNEQGVCHFSCPIRKPK